jgi:RND family efflux transporter MFP subunit
MHRLIVPILALALGYTGLSIPAGAQAPGGPPPAVTVAKPIVREVVEYSEFTGRFEAIDSVEVRARVAGYLEQVAFQDGAVVKKGDLLFVIDRRPAKAALDQAQASVVSAQARLSFAQSDLERAESLRRSGNIAEQLLDQRRQGFISAKADFDNAEAATRNAQLNYDFTEVRAPVSGRIGRKLISEGNLVQANETLLTTIVSLDPIYFYFDIDERAYLAYARALQADRQAGRSATRTALVGLTDEEPRREARLDLLDNRMDQASGTIRARAVLPNPDLFLTPGLFGTIKVAGSSPQRGILLPDEAIGRTRTAASSGSSVRTESRRRSRSRSAARWTATASSRPACPGRKTVIVAGLQRVRPGAKVTPQLRDLPPTRP